jgi:hypothetical protein
MRAPLKRYYLKSILPGLLFIGLMIGTAVLEPSVPSLAIKAGLAVLPMLPLLWIFWLYFRYLGECDELERKIEMDAMAVSSMTGVLSGFSLLLLHDFRVLQLNTGDMLSLLVLFICLAYMVTRYIAIWRFRA